MTVRKQYAVLHLTREARIDMGIATPEEIAEDAAARSELQTRWSALPWRVRFMRRQVRPRMDEAHRRWTHIVRAARGIECERDW